MRSASWSRPSSATPWKTTTATRDGEHSRSRRRSRGSSSRRSSTDLAQAEDGTVSWRCEPPGPRRPWGLEVRYDGGAFPTFFQWRYLEAGTYVIGLEPATNGPVAVSGPGGRRLTILEPGESRRYHTVVRVLDGAAACDELRDRVAGTWRRAATRDRGGPALAERAGPAATGDRAAADEGPGRGDRRRLGRAVPVRVRWRRCAGSANWASSIALIVVGQASRSQPRVPSAAEPVGRRAQRVVHLRGGGWGELRLRGRWARPVGRLALRRRCRRRRPGRGGRGPADPARHPRRRARRAPAWAW